MNTNDGFISQDHLTIQSEYTTDKYVERQNAVKSYSKGTGYETRTIIMMKSRSTTTNEDFTIGIYSCDVTNIFPP